MENGLDGAREANSVSLEKGHGSFSVMLTVVTERNRQIQGCRTN